MKTVIIAPRPRPAHTHGKQGGERLVRELGNVYHSVEREKQNVHVFYNTVGIRIPRAKPADM
jgi:hypothetical protein